MELVTFPELLETYGPVGAWIVVGVALFRFLLTRQDRLARQNLQELRRQLQETRRRMIRAELILRAYARAGMAVPEDYVRIELELHSELEHLFPEYAITYPESEE